MRLKHFNVNFGEQVFKALADESRIRMLNLILQLERRYLYPTIPITAWLDIINAIKRGDFKNPKK